VWAAWGFKNGKKPRGQGPGGFAKQTVAVTETRYEDAYFTVAALI
jgi:hypothetical protein